MGNQYNTHKEKKHICPHYLKWFQTIDTLTTHFDRGCLAIGGQQIQMPEKGDTIHFNNNNIKFKAPYVMYADFECLTTDHQCLNQLTLINLILKHTNNMNHVNVK